MAEVKDLPLAGDFDALVQAAMSALMAAKAPLASPAFTGTPTAPTAAPGTNTTQIATTAFVVAAIAALVNSSPAALDTLNELAAALGNDANFAATMTTALAGKQPLDSDLTAIAALAPSNDDIIQRKSGAWTNRTIAQLKSDLALNNVLNVAQEPAITAGTSSQYIKGNKTLGTFNTDVETLLASYRISFAAVSVGNTAGAETTLYSVSIPANTMNATGEQIEFLIVGAFASNANADKRIRLKLGATTFVDTGNLAHNGKAFTLRGFFTRTGSAAQVCDAELIIDGASPMSLKGSGAEDNTAAKTLQVTGAGTGASDVGLFRWKILKRF